VNEENGAATKNTKMFSGGEGSFITLCFGLAVAECMETPFRVLDEFDVFMDDRNRRLGLGMLAQVSKAEQTGVLRQMQYILLTPIPIDDAIVAGPHVRRHYLKPVERGAGHQPLNVARG